MSDIVVPQWLKDAVVYSPHGAVWFPEEGAYYISTDGVAERREWMDNMESYIEETRNRGDEMGFNLLIKIAQGVGDE